MDKVKVFLAVLKKHHFWVLAGLVLILGLTIYVAAAADLQGRYQTRSKKLNDAVQQARQITQVTEHPNEQKIKNWDLARDLQKEKVLASWKALYDKQQKENPWPPKLGKDFLDVIKALKPDEEIPVQQCGLYQHFIESELEPLFAIVDYRHLELIELKEGERPGAVPEPLERRAPWVAWEPWGAWPAWRAGHGGPRRRRRPNLQNRRNGRLESSGPTTDQMGVQLLQPPQFGASDLAQEDYWVYQALLNIIKKDQRQCQHAFGRGRQADQLGANRLRGRKRHRHGPKLGLRRRGRWHGHGRRDGCARRRRHARRHARRYARRHARRDARHGSTRRRGDAGRGGRNRHGRRHGSGRRRGDAGRGGRTRHGHACRGRHGDGRRHDRDGRRHFERADVPG